MSGDDAQSSSAWRSLLDPPYSVELVAELHAGSLDAELAGQLWPRVRADPDAAAVLSALDATRAGLRQLDAHPVAVPIPPAVAARIDSALAGLSAPTVGGAPVGDLAAARTRRSRRAAYLGAGVAAAAAAAAVFAFGPLAGSSDVTGTPQAAGPASPSPTAAPLELGSGTLGPQALAAVGKQDLGPLSSKETLGGCLQANGVPAATALIGASEVLLDGRRGILLLLPTGRAAVFTALVVGPECSADNPATLRRVEIGAR